MRLLSQPKYSHSFFFTNYRSDNSLTSQNNISICFVHTFACRERYKNIFNFIIKRSEYFKAHYFVLKLSSSEPRPRVTGIGISIFNLTQASIVDGGIVNLFTEPGLPGSRLNFSCPSGPAPELTPRDDIDCIIDQVIRQLTSRAD